METFKLPELICELKKLVIEFLTDYGTKNLLNDDAFHIAYAGPDENSGAYFSKKSIQDLYDSILKNNVSCSGHAAQDRGFSFKIGNVDIRNPVISAPLAGISDNTYRIFAGFFGSALTYTGMITAYGIHYNHNKSLALADITEYERPCTLQLFGSDPGVIAEAAAKVEDRADIIDINMGCSVPKILRAKSGGYLLQDEVKVEKIIKKLSSILKKPLTVKIRTGWDSNSINVLNIAKIAECSGAGAISIHGRTVKQRFSGKVDYGLIKKVKGKVKIPVIASGDIDSPERALKVLDYTGCDGIMIGRATKGRLWLIMNILMAVSGRDGVNSKIECAEFEPDVDWKKEFSKLYLKFLIYFKGENKGVKEFRKHLSWIFKGTEGINRTKYEFFKIKNFTEALNCIDRVDETHSIQ